jgi:hypothetical protein
VLRGVVGDTPIAMSRKHKHYATQTRLADGGERVIPAINVPALERSIGRRFDTLLIDCEGTPRAHMLLCTTPDACCAFDA